MSERAKLLRYLISQCDSNYKRYSRQPEEIDDINKIFLVALDEIEQTDILSAFKQWLKEEKEFPCAADILELARSIGADRRRRAVDRGPSQNPVPKVKLWTVPWAGLTWPEFTDDHRQQFVSHIASMDPKRAVGYLKYCRDWLMMPVKVFQDFMSGYATPEDMEHV